MNLDELMYPGLHLMSTSPDGFVGTVIPDDFSWKRGIQYSICGWQLFLKHPDHVGTCFLIKGSISVVTIQGAYVEAGCSGQ